MKKVISILCILAMVLCLSSCGKKPVQQTIEIKASKETLAVRNALFADGDFLSDEARYQARYYDQYLPYLNARTEQAFPDVETTNTLKKETYNKGDVYTLSNGDYENIVLYIHGGAWVWEIDSLHVSFCDELVDNLNAKVYMPIYPLAPQADYKEGFAMVEEVYDKLLKQNKPIIIMGDSAGATITLGLVLKLKDEGKKLPSKVVVMAPCADARFSNKDIDEVQKKDGMLYKWECAEYAKLWANGADLKTPQLSPLFGDYEDFPDTLLFVGTHDILYCDDMLLYNKMCKANVNATLVKGEGLWHVFSVFDVEEKAKSLEIIKDFCE